MAMLVCMAVAMFSCSKDEEEAVFAEADIMGTWTISSQDYKVNGESLTGGEGFTIGYDEGSTLSIMEDKKYEITVEDYTYEKGTWAFDGRNTLTLTDSNDGVVTYQIRSLSEESATSLLFFY